MKRFREQYKPGDAAVNSMMLDDLPDIEDVLKCPLDKFITFVANNCGYSGSAHDLNINWINPMLLKA